MYLMRAVTGRFCPSVLQEGEHTFHNDPFTQETGEMAFCRQKLEM